MNFALDSDQLLAIAPFAVVCRDDLVVQRVGPSLSKALGRDLVGASLHDAFVIERPLGVTTSAEIRARVGSTFLLRHRELELSLRCQPVFPASGEQIVFVGSLVITSESDMSRFGLGYADFAASDPTPDLLILRRAQERSLHDLAALNTELERTASQLRTANSALTEAERRYRTLVEQQPLVTYIDDLGDEVRSTFTSENVLELSGYPAERWTSEPDFFFSIVHPDDVDRVRAAHLDSVRARGPFKEEFRLLRPDGTIVWVQAEDAPVHDDGGRPLYRLGYLLDITARRTAEDELRETSTRLRTLLESLRTGALLEDEHGRIAIANNVFCSDFRIATDPLQLVGVAGWDVAQQSKYLAADPERFATRIRETVERKEAVHAEQVELADGRIFERDYVPIVVEGVDSGHLWSYRDVTQRIEAQRQIEKAHDEAIAASRAKTEFLATVSHEIRTPMHGVLGTADLLQQTRLDPEQAELVEILKGSATALLTVINDMLDLQKAEAGHMELASVPVDVGALVGGVIATLAPRAEAKGLELSVTVDDGIPRDLLGDPGRIRQILLNLVANAVKFTNEGTVSLSVRLVAADDRSATLALVVTDTGIGIPEEARERVFEPFAQVDTSSTRRHEGTGLGLSITRQLVELMDGSISLESSPGQGTTVTALVRLLPGEGTVHPHVTSPLARHGLTGTVLVAEDSPVNRELALRQLSRLGVTARAVGSGAAAVDALEHTHYDLVLMDMRMPEMNGAEATRAIRARERETGRPRATVVALTANAMLENRAACLEAGMDDFATKPIVLEDLARVLERWLPEAAPTAPARRADGIAQTLDTLADELGSPEAAHRIAELWLGELPGRLDDLRVAAASADTEQLRSCAHTLKSTSALVGAVEASDLAAAIERRATDGRPLDPSGLEKLSRAVDEAAAAVLAWHEQVERGKG